MKKILCLIFVTVLCAFALCACSRSQSAAENSEDAVPGATAVPIEGDHGEMDQSGTIEALPTLEPAEPLNANGISTDDAGDYFSIDALIDQGDSGEAVPADPEATPEAALVLPASSDVDTSTYQFSALTDTALGFTFNYPSHWINVPGVYTVCFREPAEEGKFPARVAITVKKLVHTPDEQAMMEQLTAYMRIIRNQYDKATFESGTPNMNDSFLDRGALSNTYLAYSGDNEVKGFVIGTAVGRSMCVFHFCASYDDYGPMESMMRYMLRSIQPVQSD